jgi:hypothetical protein
MSGIEDCEVSTMAGLVGIIPPISFGRNHMGEHMIKQAD